MNVQALASRVSIQAPQQCRDDELADFANLVRSGGQVTSVGLDARIRNAQLLAFHYVGSTLVGTCALKRPARRYQQRLFQEAGIPESWAAMDLELGWAVTHPDYRGQGVCSGLMENLLNRESAATVFATTAMDNLPMRCLLSRFGFRVVGKPVESREPDQHARQVWVRSPAA